MTCFCMRVFLFIVIAAPATISFYCCMGLTGWRNKRGCFGRSRTSASNLPGWRGFMMSFPGWRSIVLCRMTHFIGLRAFLSHKRKKPAQLSGLFELGVWRCATLTWGSPTLPSPLTCFTSEFGMGSGGATSLWPPDKKGCYRRIDNITIWESLIFNLSSNFTTLLSLACLTHNSQCLFYRPL